MVRLGGGPDSLGVILGLGCTTDLLGMILLGPVSFGPESQCLSDGGQEPGWTVAGVLPELVPAAAGVPSAQGDDVRGAFDGPVHA